MLGLEHTATGDATERNFEKLAQLVPDTGGKSIGVRFGGGSVTWAGGSRLTPTSTIAHGLGKAPVAVVFGSTTTNLHVAVTSSNATNLVVQGNTLDGSSPANGTQRFFYWIAIG